MKKLLTVALCLLSVPAFAYKTIELNEKNTINFNQAFSSELNEKNTINFNQAFSSRFVAKKQIEAIKLCSQNVGSEINIVLYTPGGSISAGQRLYDTLNALPCKFNTITLFAASMGYQTVQQLGNRYILPSGILMSHRASVRGLGGEIGGELDSIVKLLNDNVRELELIASNRVGITLPEYQTLIRDELWMTGSQSVKMNHADEIVFARCDKSLLGTKLQRVYSIFGAFDVEYSQCPIITGALSVQPVNSNSNLEKFTEMLTNIKKYVKTEL